MKTQNFDLNKLRVASPCSVGWESMTGDERSRMCGQCNRYVYNVSSMSASDVEQLVTRRTDNICIRLFRRSDGTVLVNDCPVGLRLVKRCMGRFVAAAFASILGLVTVGYSQRSEKPKPSPPKAENIDETGRGSLNGLVLDSAGATIPGVQLELFQEGVKKPRKLLSDAEGNFSFLRLPAGIFRINARFPGFKKTVIEKIVLNDRETASIKLVMEVGDISVTVGLLDYQE